jgi:nucleoside-diphosphate-sugar epimerase
VKVLITGAGGFVGKRLTAAMASAGHDVVALVHTPPLGRDIEYFNSPRIVTIAADLATFDPATLPSGIEGVIALAQSSHFREFPERARQVFDVNVTANLRLLDWAVRSGVRRFVLASSGGIYGGKLGAQFHETDVFPVSSPLGFYLGSKLSAEIVFQNYRHFFDCAVIVRPFFIYGPAQRPDMFVARIVHSVRDGRPITLQGPEGLRINPIHVDDAVHAFARALGVMESRIVNIAGGDILSLRSLAEMASRHLGKAPVYHAAEGDPVDYVADIALARQLLDLQPRAFADGLADMMRRP